MKNHLKLGPDSVLFGVEDTSLPGLSGRSLSLSCVGCFFFRFVMRVGIEHFYDNVIIMYDGCHLV